MRIWVIDLFILKQGLMKQWKQSFELEMVLWRLNLKWSDEDWTWNGLMKIELEMVLWRLNCPIFIDPRPFQVQSSLETISSPVFIRDHFKFNLHQTISSSIFIRPFQVQSSSDQMVSEEDWTWNGLWWRLDLKWSLMKTGLEMVSNEDWAWNGLGSMKIGLEMVSEEDWTSDIL
jgi:hypothetical protein